MRSGRRHGTAQVITINIIIIIITIIISHHTSLHSDAVATQYIQQTQYHLLLLHVHRQIDVQKCQWHHHVHSCCLSVTSIQLVTLRYTNFDFRSISTRVPIPTIWVSQMWTCRRSAGLHSTNTHFTLDQRGLLNSRYHNITN